MRKRWKMWVGWAVSLVAIVFAIRTVPFGAFADSMSRAALVWIIPALALNVCNLGFRAWRWSLIMGGKTPFWTTFHANNIGYMLNNVLPLRLGEVGRAYVIGERTSVSMTRAFSSVIVERVLDLASVLLLFAAIVPFVDMPPFLSRAATVSSAIVAIAIIGGGVLVWQSSRAERLMRRILKRASDATREKIVARFVDLCEGFRAVGSASRVLGVLALTVVIWLNSIFIAYITLHALMPARFDEADLVVVSSNLGGAVPSAPGGLGVIEAAAKESLAVAFHVSEADAFAFAILFANAGRVLVIAMGLFGLARVGLRFSDVRVTGSEVAAEKP